MLQNAYFLAKIGADTAENEQHFAEIWPIGAAAAAENGAGPVNVRELEGADGEMTVGIVRILILC